MTKEELAKLAAQLESNEISDDDLEVVAGGATRAELRDSFAKMKAGEYCPYIQQG